jgi:TM2 domain-containing membrane protein YozV
MSRPTKFCHACGAEIDAQAVVCPKCGVGQSTGGSKSKIAAGLFALLLGGLGAHKFYLGKIGQGFLYLLFCWTFVPAVVALVEGILYLTKSDAEFAQKYG